jgi:hypothetical protein
MATKYYKNIPYDVDADYQSIYNENKAKGASSEVLDYINQTRAAKVYGENKTDYFSTVDPKFQSLAPTIPAAQPAIPAPAPAAPAPAAPVAPPAGVPGPGQVVESAGAPTPTGSTGTPFKSQFGDQIGSFLSSISGMISKPAQYDPNTDPGLQSAQKSAIDAVMRAAARRNMLYSSAEKANAQESAMSLVPQFQARFDANQQQQLGNLFSMLNSLQGLDTSEYNKFKDDRSRVDSQNAALGMVTDPKTGQLVKTAAQQEKEKNDWVSSMEGQGDNFDYKAEIDAIANDNDPSNDWKLPHLRKFRQAKQDAKLKTEIATVSQYYSDYQAEINKRPEGDPLLPYLKMARVSKMIEQKEKAKTEEEKKFEKALSILKEYGELPAKLAQDLGIEANAQTLDYMKTMADISHTKALTYKDYNPSSGSSGTKENTNEYNAVRNTLSDSSNDSASVEKMVWQLVNNEGGAQDALGAKFDEAVKDGRNWYFNKLTVDWANSNPEDIIGSLNSGLNGDPNFYSKMLGSENFSKLKTAAEAKIGKGAKAKEEGQKSAAQRWRARISGMKVGEAKTFLQANKNTIVNEIGDSLYYDLVTDTNKGR